MLAAATAYSATRNPYASLQSIHGRSSSHGVAVATEKAPGNTNDLPSLVRADAFARRFDAARAPTYIPVQRQQ
eukprot:COSAG05_NODE_1495_length_4710_cov_19.079592_3_plen_73_part_00